MPADALPAGEGSVFTRSLPASVYPRSQSRASILSAASSSAVVTTRSTACSRSTCCFVRFLTWRQPGEHVIAVDRTASKYFRHDQH